MASNLSSSAYKINLRLPAAGDLFKDRPSSQLPMSRTDILVESAFASETRLESTPKPENYSGFKSLQSITKLKETLTRTSQKLKTYSIPADLTKLNLTQSEMVNEINKLRLDVKNLENEK